MAAEENFTLLRTILRAFGLSQEAIDDIVERILDFLAVKQDKPVAQAQFPYALRDDFLSAAEQSFCMVLRGAVAEQVMICPKVALGDLFFAKTGDPRQNRICTNRIDRKHVDFLLCDPKTLRPLAGIELDDKSHQRADRQARDEFVEGVFVAANLPLVRVPVRHGYSATELRTLLLPHLPVQPMQQDAKTPIANKAPGPPRLTPIGDEAYMPHVPASKVNAAPRCPKCASEMVLRTAKSGANQGAQFWGCSHFPRCRTIVALEDKL